MQPRGPPPPPPGGYPAGGQQFPPRAAPPQGYAQPGAPVAPRQQFGAAPAAPRQQFGAAPAAPRQQFGAAPAAPRQQFGTPAPRSYAPPEPRVERSRVAPAGSHPERPAVSQLAARTIAAPASQIVVAARRERRRTAGAAPPELPAAHSLAAPPEPPADSRAAPLVRRAGRSLRAPDRAVHRRQAWAPAADHRQGAALAAGRRRLAAAAGSQTWLLAAAGGEMPSWVVGLGSEFLRKPRSVQSLVPTDSDGTSQILFCLNLCSNPPALETRSTNRRPTFFQFASVLHAASSSRPRESPGGQGSAKPVLVKKG